MSKLEKVYNDLISEIAVEARSKNLPLVSSWRNSHKLQKAEKAFKEECEALSPDEPCLAGSSVFGDSWAAGLAG